MSVSSWESEVAESNGVPFLVLTSEESQPVRSGIEVEVFDHQDPTKSLGILPRRWGVTCLDEVGRVGGGSFSIWKRDPSLLSTPRILDDRNLVKVRVDQRTVGGFLIKSQESDFVSGAEVSGEAIKVAGEGLKTWFRDAVVFPYRGLKSKSQGSRVFSFASERGPWYKPGDWKTPIKIQQHSLDPNPGPWGTAPAQWPDVPDAWWVWGVDNGKTNPAPEGYNYFRFEFPIAASVGTKSYSLFAAGDNNLVAYVDGQRVMEAEENDSWTSTTRADFDLDPGEHILAIRVRNASDSPAALIAALFRAGDAAEETPAELLTYTGWPSASTFATRLEAATLRMNTAYAKYLADQAEYDRLLELHKDDEEESEEVTGAKAALDQSKVVYEESQAEWNTATVRAAWAAEYENAGYEGWKVNPYPDPAPGWTVGEILLTLLEEARERGVRFPNFLTPTFTGELDSDGLPWSRALDWDFSIGQEYYEVLEKLEEALCDIWIDPESLEMHAYVERSRDRSTQSSSQTPVIFEVGRNVVKAAQSSTADIKNTLVLSTKDGWRLQGVSQGDSLTRYGRVEGSLSTGLSSSVSGDVALAVLGQKASTQESYTYDIIDVDAARPFVDFNAGDWVLAPDKNLDLVRVRVMSISVAEETATGRPEYSIEFGSIAEDVAERHERWLKTLSSGSMGGSYANAGGGGSSSPTGSSTQARLPGPPGAKGDPGLKWTGTWSAGRSYARNDAVHYQGSTWLALASNTGVTPVQGTYWTRFAQKGTDGREVELRTSANLLQWRYAGYESWSTLFDLTALQGKSAYQIAQDNGYGGTEVQWLASLEGADGKSAYQTALDNGFVGSETQWLASMKGASAYQIAVSAGFSGTETDWLASLHGSSGLSAYGVALQQGFVGSEDQWLASLRGPAGAGVPETAAEGDVLTFSNGEWVGSAPTGGGGSGLPASASEGDVLTFVNGEWVAAAPTGGGGGGWPRATLTHTVGPLNEGATATGSLTLAAGYVLYRIATSRPYRVRLYASEAQRNADLNRPLGTDVVRSSDHGLILEAVTSASLTAFDLTPHASGHTSNGSPSVPFAITALDVSGDGTMTLTWLRTE